MKDAGGLLIEDIAVTFKGDSILIREPFGTDLTSLVPSIAFTRLAYCLLLIANCKLIPLCRKTPHDCP